MDNNQVTLSRFKPRFTTTHPDLRQMVKSGCIGMRRDGRKEIPASIRCLTMLLRCLHDSSTGPLRLMTAALRFTTVEPRMLTMPPRFDSVLVRFKPVALRPGPRIYRSNPPPPKKKKKNSQNLNTPKIFVVLKTPKYIKIQNFEPPKITRAYVCMKISE